MIKDGKPVLSAAALTGASLSDSLPPDAVFNDSDNAPISGKVTPAGRYTISAVKSDDYGTAFNVNELYSVGFDGKNLSKTNIAIHSVYTANKAEKRMDRLNSATPDDNHISFGCINVDKKTVASLSQHLEGRASTPIYILPQDQSPEAMATFFPKESKPMVASNVSRGLRSSFAPS